MDPGTVFYGVLLFLWAEYAWEAYLGSRQRKVYKKHTTMPESLRGILDEETFGKARRYALDKSNFGAVQGVIGQVISTLIIWFWGYKWAWDFASDALGGKSSEIVVSLLFVLILNLWSYVMGLPFSIYDVFVLEQKHGFNKQTPGFYIKDQIKTVVLTQALTLPIVAGILKVIQLGGDYFFIALWFFALCLTLFLMIVYPEIIAPLFDKYTPLPEGELRSKIEALASSIEFPLYKLFVVEGSKRSSHSNAYFYGFFKFKRIVLFDTLLEESERAKLKTDEDSAKEEKEDDKRIGCTTNEILAVLAHELGHWKLNHVFKNIVISEIHIFAMFALFNYLYAYQNIYSAFGFTDQRPVLIGLVIILQFITVPFNAVLSFAMTILSRRFEFQADAFAVGLGKADQLKSALIRLNNDNLGFPIYDSWFSAWHHSHPPLLERIEELERKKDK